MVVGVQEGYRLWSRSYDQDANPILSLERRVIRQRLNLIPASSFLDIATGTGYWLLYALSRGATAIGLDLSPEMLHQAASKPGLQNHLVQADMTALPLRDSAADIAVCSLAIGYLPSVQKFFRELSRVSRRVVVSDLHESAVEAGWQRCFEADGCRYQIEQYEHTVSELDDAAKGAGLRVEWRESAYIGEPEREFFVRARREYAFSNACRIPAILSTCWIRQ